MNYKILLLLAVISLSSCNSKKNEPDPHEHDGSAHSHSHDSTAAKSPSEILEKQTVASTAVSPEYIQLATNVEIVANIRDAVKSTGVLTHEGVFGPLLFGEKIRAFFIELKPGMFLSEHPHPTESIVYTVSGKWVLCSEGKRQVMETGSAFHFGSNMPTGWEAPFMEGALLFVVKSKEGDENYESYMKGLLEVKQTMENDRAAGTTFYFNELKPDHAAMVFARQVNPDFDAVLKSIKY
jgi:quercetin dioxygenase-like cupin family protein